MGKHGKALKKRRLEQQAAQATLALADGALSDLDDENEQQSPPSGVDLSHLGGLVTPSQLALTVKTLDTLSRHSELLANKEDAVHLRPLRRAVHDFHRTANQLAGTGNSLASRISAALTQHRHLDALVLLAELRLRGQSPKLGSLQRWVRDLDAASRDDGSFGDSEVLRVLDAILRCTNGEPEHDEEADGLIRGTRGQVVVRQRDWVHRKPRDGDIYAEIVAGRFPRESLGESWLLSTRDERWSTHAYSFCRASPVQHPRTAKGSPRASRSCTPFPPPSGNRRTTTRPSSSPQLPVRSRSLLLTRRPSSASKSRTYRALSSSPTS